MVIIFDERKKKRRKKQKQPSSSSSRILCCLCGVCMRAVCVQFFDVHHRTWTVVHDPPLNHVSPPSPSSSHRQYYVVSFPIFHHHDETKRAVGRTFSALPPRGLSHAPT
mmetsp:Transcript_29115/g.50313  ORF Transcript_29115/g.50313 Transcript_29115/m.50313 type:complete len:109 (-) Transcript_29115:52-378(-)